jgi:hypothetical protein
MGMELPFSVVMIESTELTSGVIFMVRNPSDPMEGVTANETPTG